MTSQPPVKLFRTPNQLQNEHTSDTHQPHKQLHTYSSHNFQKLEKIKAILGISSNEKWELVQKIMSHENSGSSETIPNHEINIIPQNQYSYLSIFFALFQHQD